MARLLTWADAIRRCGTYRICPQRLIFLPLHHVSKASGTAAVGFNNGFSLRAVDVSRRATKYRREPWL